MTAAKYFRTPKGLLIPILLGLAIVGGWGAGWAEAARNLIAAGGIGMAVDALLLRWRKGRWVFPDGALLTGLLVALVLSRQTPVAAVAVTTIVAVLSKVALRTHITNIFNPAAFGLLATFFVYHPAQDWWGSLPAWGLPGLALVVAVGAFLAHRVRRLPVVLSFLGFFYLGFTLLAYLGEPTEVVGIFRGADLHAVVFLALFMVTDPPTSPTRSGDQVVFGLVGAAAAVAVFLLTHAVYFFLAGLLVANAAEAWRRLRAEADRKRIRPAAVPRPAG